MKKSISYTILFILFLFTGYTSLTAANYRDIVADIVDLDKKIDSLTYNGETEETFTETFKIVGVASNTIPVDWIVIGFSKGDAGTFYPRSQFLDGNLSNDNIDYNIFDSLASGNILLNKANASSWNDLIRIYVGGQTGSFVINTSFSIKIPDSQSVLNGLFKDQPITARLFGLLDLNGTGPQTTFLFSNRGKLKLLDIYRFKIHTHVEYDFKLSIVDHNAPFNFDSSSYSLDFGTIDPGEVMSADMIVNSHGAYSISVESMYGSRLKHTQVNEYVDYSLSFNTSPVSLTAGTPTSLVTNAPASFTPGDRYPFSITMETLIDAPAGDYEDYLTFEITGN